MSAMPGPCARPLKGMLFRLLGVQGAIMFLFVILAPAILFNCITGRHEERLWKLKNSVQTISCGQNRCLSTTLGGSAHAGHNAQIFAWALTKRCVQTSSRA